MSDSYRLYPRKQLSEVAATEPSSFVDGPFGSNLKSDEYVSEGVRLIQLQNIGDGHWRNDSKKFINWQKFATLSRHGAKPGDIAIAKMADPVARACVIPPIHEQFIVVADCIKLTVDTECHDARFVERAINSAKSREEAEARSLGSTRMRINLSEFKKVTIPCPELHSQRKISRILDALDTQIRQTEALIAKLERIKQGLLTDLLSRGIDQNGQLRPTPDQAPHLYKNSPLGQLPEEWAIKTIAELPLDLIDGDRGVNYPSEGDFTESAGYCLFLSAKNVTKDGFLFNSTQFISKQKDKALGTGEVLPGDVVITTRGTVGNFAFFDDTVLFSRIRINSGMLILRNRAKDLVSEYVYLSLKEIFFDIEQRRKGSGSAQPQLPAKDLKTFCLPTPHPNEQHRITEAIKKYLTRIES